MPRSPRKKTRRSAAKPESPIAVPARTLSEKAPVSAKDGALQTWYAICDTEHVNLVEEGSSQSAHHAASVHLQANPDHKVRVVGGLV